MAASRFFSFAFSKKIMEAGFFSLGFSSNRLASLSVIKAFTASNLRLFV